MIRPATHSRLATARALGLAALLPALAGAAAWALAAEPEPAPGARAVVPSETRWEGVSSCSATACHGGPSAGGGSASAYTTWVAADPHTRAHDALFDRRSAAMADALAAATGRERVAPQDDARCLACHVHPGADSAPHAPRFRREDGVSCEACHGAAGRWLEPHSRPGWEKTEPAARAALGMVATGDIAERARACVGCHVGAPGQEVDHDLIAAGHPRLAFEFATYLANLPRHWDDAADRRAHPDLEARAWSIGQVVSARAALALLAERAGGAQTRPWPEFSEYGCFACHQDLEQPAPRAAPAADGRRPGSLPFGSWYDAMLAPLARATGREDLVGPDSPLVMLRNLMGRPYPDPVQVRELAGQVVAQLDRWIEEASAGGTEEAGAIARQLAAFARPDRPVADWDGAAQRVAALAALDRALAAGGATPDPERRAALDELFERLAFPDGFDSPHRRSGWDPDRFAALLQRIRP